MSRRAARELVLHLIFQNGYSPDKQADQLLESFVNPGSFQALAEEYPLYSSMPEKSQNDYIKTALTGVLENAAQLDDYIAKYSVGWSLNRISRIAKCILRLCMYETKYMGIPVKASVNEAVELSKQYDSEEAAQFVNGIMASFIKDELQGKPSPDEAPQDGEVV